MDDKKVIINVEIDLDEVNNIVSEALKLEDNAELFTKLAEFAKIKKQIADAVEAIDRVEVDIKGVINAKAKQLYGNDWQLTCLSNRVTLCHLRRQSNGKADYILRIT